MNASDTDRRDFEEMVPWFVAGLLSPEETARFEAALQQDAALRANVAAARAELASAVADNENAGAPSRLAWDRIAGAIAAAPRNVSLYQRLREACAALFERAAGVPMAAAAFGAAAALVIVVQGAALVYEQTARGPASYQTASDASQRRSGAQALVAFAPDASIGRVGQILAAHGATIVDGPRAGRLYRIILPEQLTTPTEIGKAIADLRAEPGVAAVLAAPDR